MRALLRLAGSIFSRFFGKAPERKTVVVAPGHNPKRPGVRNPRLGLIEHEEVLKVVSLLAEMLQSQGFKVVKVFGSLQEKVQSINNILPDAAVEVHFNSPASGTGTECLYFHNKPLAEELQKTLVQELGLRDRGVKIGYYRGDPEKGILYFLRAVKKAVPTCIVEPLFLTNDTDAQFLFSEDGHLRIARALTQGIANYLES